MSEADTDLSSEKLSGIWRTEYTYHNSSKGKDMTSVHYVRLVPKPRGFVVETIRRLNEAYMLARFSLDGDVATGSWQESTSPQGDYRGVMYHGAGQLIIAKDGKQMQGKWVGFGKGMDVKTGPWKFEFLGTDESVLDNLETATGQ